MTSETEITATDDYVMRSCRWLVRNCEEGLPKGETAESIAELVEVHRKALALVKQRPGKAVMTMQMNDLAARYVLTPPLAAKASDDAEFKLQGDPVNPREEPLMREALETFEGTWV